MPQNPDKIPPPFRNYSLSCLMKKKRSGYKLSSVKSKVSKNECLQEEFNSEWLFSRHASSKTSNHLLLLCKSRPYKQKFVVLTTVTLLDYLNQIIQHDNCR